MQAARDLVSAAPELSTGVERGEHHLERGALRRGMHAGRDATAVVQHRYRFVRVEDDLDRVAPAGESLVDAVVDELDHQVVQTAEIGRPDVHTGPAANRLQPLEDLDLVGGIGVFGSPTDVGGMGTRGARFVDRGAFERVLVGAVGACGVGYVWRSGCDVSVGRGAGGWNRAIAQRGPFKSAVPSASILPAGRPTSHSWRGALH